MQRLDIGGKSALKSGSVRPGQPGGAAAAAAAVPSPGDMPPAAAEPMPDRVEHGEQEGAALEPAVTASSREADADSVRGI